MRKSITEEEAKQELDDKTGKAEELLQDEKKLNKFLSALGKKISMGKVAEKLDSVLDYIKLMISLVKSYISKEYKEVPWKTIISIVGALLYVFSPIDLIPDFLAVVGFVDDVAVVSICLKSIQGDLDIYKNWLDAKKNIIEQKDNGLQK